LLARARSGDTAAIHEVTPLVYDELRRVAYAVFQNEQPGHTLQPTALVNEAFVRLFAGQLPEFTDRAHFLAIAARSMRQILVDHARGRRAQKRGSGLKITFHEGFSAAQPLDDLLELDGALEKLGQEDDRFVILIEMRFFGGMTAEEISTARQESVHAVRHDLRYAQARLRTLLGTAKSL
jgi:RNA polymerase sigma-70 factor (ECF subfamily)